MECETDPAREWADLVKESPVGGDGLFAWKDVDAGEAIVTIHRPIVTTLDSRRLRDTCANCFQFRDTIFLRELVDESESPLSLKTCTGCKTLRYCSKKCQSESWKREHKSVCKVLGKIHEKGTLPHAARAVLRMLQIAVRPDARRLRNMKSHLNEITKRGGERAEKLLILSTGIHQYSGTPLGIEYVQAMFALVFTNSLTLHTSTFDPLGICVDPLAAKANHSCDPNCACVWDRCELQFRTLKPIKEGEEIFISYIDPSQPYSRRQRELDDKFCFSCKCPKCQLMWSGPNDKFLHTPKPDHTYGKNTILNDARGNIATSIMEDASRRDKNDPDNLGSSDPEDSSITSLTFVQKFAYENLHVATTHRGTKRMMLLDSGLQACLGTCIWPESRQPVPMLRHEAFSNYVAIGARSPEAYDLAFLQGLKLYFESWPVIHPQAFHPMRVTHSWALAHLALQIANRNESLHQDLELGVILWGFLKEVASNVQRSHGKGHRFAATVTRKIDQVRTDMTRSDPLKIEWVEKQIERQWRVLRKLSRNAEVNTFKQFRKETDKDIDEMARTGELQT